jgi:hypothetical protein
MDLQRRNFIFLHINLREIIHPSNEVDGQPAKTANQEKQTAKFHCKQARNLTTFDEPPKN